MYKKVPELKRTLWSKESLWISLSRYTFIFPAYPVVFSFYRDISPLNPRLQGQRPRRLPAQAGSRALRSLFAGKCRNRGYSSSPHGFCLVQSQRSSTPFLCCPRDWMSLPLLLPGTWWQGLHDLSVVRIPSILQISFPSSGRPLNLDWNDIPIDFGPFREKRFSREKANPQSESAGLVIVSVQDAGLY